MVIDGINATGKALVLVLVLVKRNVTAVDCASGRGPRRMTVSIFQFENMILNELWELLVNHAGPLHGPFQKGHHELMDGRGFR